MAPLPAELNYDAPLPADLLPEITLTIGDHKSRDSGVCVMEVVAWLAGEPHSDAPQCACPTIRAYAMRINDEGPQWVRDALKDRAIKIVGTRGSIDLQKRRGKVFAVAAIKHAELVLPIFEQARPNDDRPRKAIEAAKNALAADAADAAAAADAADAADAAAGAAGAAGAAVAAGAAAGAAAVAARAAYAAAGAARAAARAAYAAAGAARAAARAAYAAAGAAADEHWNISIAALDEALAITEAA